MMLELFVRQQQTRSDFIARQGPQRQVVGYKSLFSNIFPCDSSQLFCCAYFEKTARFAEIFLLWQILVMILNDFFECSDAISCNLLLCFTQALSFWTFAMCRGFPVCFFIVDRPTSPIYIGISKTKTKDIARQFARIHQWKQSGLPQH